MSPGEEVSAAIRQANQEISARPFGRERREFPRVCQPPLEVLDLEVRVRDVSEGGICLTPDLPLEWSTHCRIVLSEGPLPGQELAAEVRWRQHGFAGLRWVNVSPAQRLWLRLCSRRWKRSLVGGSIETPTTGKIVWAQDEDLLVEVVREALPEALHRLPRRQRQAVIWYFYEGLSVTELAAVRHIQPASARALLRRALESLRGHVLSGLPDHPSEP